MNSNFKQNKVFPYMCITQVPQRKRTNKKYLRIREIELILRNWLIWLQRLASLISIGRLITQERVNVEAWVRRQSGRQNSLFLGNGSLFLLRPSTNYIKPTHIMEGALLYWKSIDLNINLIKNIFIPTSKLVFNQMFGSYGLVKLVI